MINPVLAYYQLRLLHNIYITNTDPTDSVISDTMSSIISYYDNMEFDNFSIIRVYGDGSCVIRRKITYKHEWCALKDILEVK